MSMENPPPPALIRIPVRIVVLVVVLPVRMVWDVLTSTARLLDRTVLRPAGRGLARVFTGVGWAVAWLFHHTAARPARWLYGAVLAPAARGLAAGVRFLGNALFVWPWVGLWRYVVVPGCRYGIAVPARWLHRTVLRPAGHGVVRALTAVGEGLGWFLPRLGRGVAAVAVWLGKAVFVWPWVGLWRYVVVPGCRYGIAVPAVWLYRRVLDPLGSGLVFLVEKLVLVPVAALFRYVLVPLFRYGVVVPVLWFDRYVLTPVGEGLGWFLPRLGRGVAAVAVWLGKAVFVWPWVGLWRYVLVPVVVYGLVRPLGWLWNRVLVPVGREVRDAFVLCWRAAGFVSRAVGRALAWLARFLVVRPVVWVWVSVVRPAGRWVRDTVRSAARLVRDSVRSAGRWVRDRVWAPARRVAVETGRAAKDALAAARAAVRQARRDTWRALGGAARTDRPGEPKVARARTLGSTTNVPGAAPAPEISPRKRG
ncbi:hypothetical protein [Streptomyces sp. NPDC093795]|uniref:hypothetical protein n=1 Tax=Streptomyces sp. NPDC093795 TaxID=3366051 RepID=UPI0038050FAF